MNAWAFNTASRNREVREGVMKDAQALLQGYGLTTAEILYRMPDHPAILQSYVWQEYDLAPRFPELRGFLHFWKRNLDGPLFRVIVAHRALVKPAEIRLITETKLH